MHGFKFEYPLLVGETSDGKRVALAFTNAGGRISLEGQSLIETDDASAVAVEKLTEVFYDLCGKELIKPA